MDIFLVLLLLLFVSRAFGEVAHRLGQPPLVGELVAGITLGAVITAEADLLPGFAQLTDDPVFIGLTDLGIFFLMLLGGVELRASELGEVSAKSFVVATSGLLLPLGVGFVLAWFFLPESELKTAQCLFVGTALAITAVPVSIRVLMDLGKLRTAAGRMIVSAAIIDDILSLILVAFLVGFMTSGGLPDAGALVHMAGAILLFFVIVIVLYRLVVPRVGQFVTSLKTAELEFSSLLLAALAFAVLAELLHLHFIVGAFIAGLFFERRVAGRHTYDEVKERVSAITLGFLAPIFFASIGMHLNVGAVVELPLFVAVLIVVAFVTKLVGAGVPAYLLGLAPRQALAVGVGMSARGAVELIIAGIALRAGLFSQPQPTPPEVSNLFSAIILVALVTTVASPMMLRRVFAPT